MSIPFADTLARFGQRCFGVALIAGGIGLVVPLTARLAATLAGGMIFIWLIVLAMSAIAFSPVARPTGATVA